MCSCLVPFFPQRLCVFWFLHCGWCLQLYGRLFSGETSWTTAGWRSLSPPPVVLDIVPDLMSYREKVQLIMGLRAQLVLELCRSEHLADSDTIQPRLNT
ncbi:hypothetical protein J4Q44_G00291780 [Coregonus suidteri]|uniref:TERF1-interacting nuclear factor 2 N-terminal domain-containing protein n=1 Tax=Coregonus suidteri TaxID=861788 RepID=A0AAN8L4D2_9TELE